jgi:3-methyladenine DNA glycosylase AlkC
MMEENFALKDMFSRESVGVLAAAIADVHPGFPIDKFVDCVFDDSWEGLALKQRVRQIALNLGKTLPGDYLDALEILKDAMPLLEEQGFEKMVFPDFVEVYGLDDWYTSISALEFFTQFMSAEFAIRPFISRYPEKTLQQMITWAEHEHPGVRRLASEGCRPRLPWGLRLHDLVADPGPIFPVLEILKDDPREEIRRSVANNLNDISKDHPDLVVKFLEKWHDPDDLNRSRLIKHALRTLLKAGHPSALSLLGYSSNPEITVENISLEPGEIRLGEDVVFSFEILSTAKYEQKLMVDYLVHFMKANGTQAPKVFKLSQKTIQPGERIKITRKHGIKPITTRKYYPGIQTFQPQVNGKKFGKVNIVLTIPEK